MKFVIDNETNRIQIHSNAKTDAMIAGAERFKSEAELGKLAASWPAARLVAIWNSIPGVVPVSKFKDRATGVARIWKAIQAAEPKGTTEPTVEPATRDTVAPEAAQAPDVAPEESQATVKATRAEKAPEAAKEAKAAHAGSKTANVLDLIQREGGASLAEIMEATGWQAHSVRGFISGTLGKKMGLTVISAKGEDGVRRYSINA